MMTRAQAAYEVHGQSLWYDNVHRGELDSGRFGDLVEQGVRGCTSNPTIFEKAIGGSHAYDDALLELTRTDASVERIYYDLIVDDIRRAADLLAPVHGASSRRDGYVSVEQHRFRCQFLREPRRQEGGRCAAGSHK